MAMPAKSGHGRFSLNGGAIVKASCPVVLALLCAGATPALAAPAHCEADTGPGLSLISETFEDAGKDLAAVARQWTAYAVQNKASSAKCISGSAEEAIDDAYGGTEFRKTGWKPGP
jgi:hypothetical protein